MSITNLGTSTTSYATGYSNQRKIVETDTGILVLFAIVDGALKYKTSDDYGTTWDGSWTQVQGATVYSFDVYIESNNDILVVYDGDSSGLIYFRRLTYSEDTWSVGSAVLANDSSDRRKPVITVRSNGDIWVIATVSAYPAYVSYTYSTNGGSSFSSSASLNTGVNISSTSICPKDTYIWFFCSNTNGDIKLYEYDSSFDSGTVIISGLKSTSNISLIKVSNSEIWTVGETSSGIKVFEYDGSWDSGTLLSDNTNDKQPNLSYVDSNPVVTWVDYDGANYDIAYRTFNGSSWDSQVNITSDSAVDNYPSSVLTHSSYLSVVYTTGSGSPYTIYVDVIQIGAALETVIHNDTLTLSEETDINIPQENVSHEDSISLSESYSFEHIEEVTQEDSLSLSDEILINIPQESVTHEDTLNLSESTIASVPNIAKYCNKIVHMNSPYLLMITGGDVAKITKVDISDPDNPSWNTYTLAGSGQSFQDANDFCVNETFERIYVACGSGLIADIDLNDLESVTEIDTGDTDDLMVIDSLEDWDYIYAGTDDSDGELIMLDDSTIKQLNSDFRFLIQQTQIIESQLNTLFATKIDSDFKFLINTNKKIRSDLRFLKYSYTNIPLNAISRTDFHVYIDDVEITDIDLASIRVILTTDAVGQASFNLGRRHDNPDYTIDGTYSQITNQNNVKVYIQSKLIFEGKIQEINALGSSEKIEVSAKTDSEPNYTTNRVTLPLSSVNTQRHLYDVVLDDIIIDNPTISETRLVIMGDNGKYWSGSNWVYEIESATTFSTFSSAESYINAVNETNTLFHDENPYVTNYDESPDKYRGIIVKLGTIEEEMVLRGANIRSPSILAEEVVLGEWKPKQNFTYFWRAEGLDFYNNKTFSMRYIGTSPSSLTSELIWIDGLRYNYQREFDNIETNAGQYAVGNPPYREVNTKNGRYISKWKYFDGENGLWTRLNAWFNYIDFAKKVADIEYEKLKNINDDISPDTRANISLTIDAYLFYKLGILTRINLDNTTQATVYKNNNGFPVAIKEIEINSNTMLVNLSCDNTKSRYEMDLLDDEYPDEDDPQYSGDAVEGIVASKFDPSRWEWVE